MYNNFFPVLSSMRACVVWDYPPRCVSIPIIGIMHFPSVAYTSFAFPDDMSHFVNDSCLCHVFVCVMSENKCTLVNCYIFM